METATDFAPDSLLSKPEKLILLCDMHTEMNSPWDECSTRIEVLKQALASFVKRKCNSMLQHKIAVASFTSSRCEAGMEDIHWHCSFSRTQETILSAIDKLLIAQTSIQDQETQEVDPNEADYENSCSRVDLPVILNQVFDKIRLPVNDEALAAYLSDVSASSENYVYRVLLIYGRSLEIPQVDASVPALRCPNVFLDILYLHHKIAQSICSCQEIFDVLAHLQSESLHSNGYIFETHPSTIKLYTFMSAFMAHPVQRDTQQEFLRKLDYF